MLTLWCLYKKSSKNTRWNGVDVEDAKRFLIRDDWKLFCLSGLSFYEAVFSLHLFCAKYCTGVLTHKKMTSYKNAIANFSLIPLLTCVLHLFQAAAKTRQMNHVILLYDANKTNKYKGTTFK